MSEALGAPVGPEAAWSLTLERVLWPLLERTTFEPTKALVQAIREGLHARHLALATVQAWAERIECIRSDTMAALVAMTPDITERHGVIAAYVLDELRHKMGNFIAALLSPIQTLEHGIEHEDTETPLKLLRTVMHAEMKSDEQAWHAIAHGRMPDRGLFTREFALLEATKNLPASMQRIATDVEKRLHLRTKPLRTLTHGEFPTISVHAPTRRHSGKEKLLPHPILLSEQITEVAFNAIKVMLRSGAGSYVSVTIQQAPDTGDIVIHIADDGPGAGGKDPETFFRDGYSGVGTSGQGLGIVRANLHRFFGGSITAEDNAVEDADLPGMLFTIHIPHSALIVQR